MGSGNNPGRSACRTEAEDRTRLAALPVRYFEPLFALLPTLEGPLWPREKIPDQKDEKGRRFFLPPPLSPVASAFSRLSYELHLVLRWTSWMDFMSDHPFMEQPDMIDTFDRYQCCMAITAIVRAERFGDGMVEGRCRDGKVARIIRRLQRIPPAAHAKGAVL